MSKAAPLILLAIIAAAMCGCGSSNGTTSTLQVAVQPVRAIPKNLTINVNDTVTWVDQDSAGAHQIVSGTLDATRNPIVVAPPIAIQQNNVFTPAVLAANYGDTIQWVSNRTGAFIMDILDDANNIVASHTFPSLGDLFTFNAPSAGFYTFQQHDNPNFKGTVTFFGLPNPNGLFQGPVMSSAGATFPHQFTTRGTFNYFDQDPNTGNAFIIGTVTVQ